MQRECIVLWGTGIKAKEIIDNYVFFKNIIHIVGVIDNNENNWGKTWGIYTVLNPNQICELEFDKVVISTSIYFNEIKEQLVNNFGVPSEKIENNLYFAKRKLLFKYKNSSDKEICHVINRLSHNYLQVFNYQFTKLYENMPVKMAYDKAVGLYYVIHHGKRVYMARSFDTEDKVAEYYRGICMEQDKDSPHVYLDESFQINEGSVVLDVGVAEGNFSLEVVDKASKVYMVEADKEWIEALNYTFAEYKGKVTIINAFISDRTDSGTYKLDDIINEPVNFIKMDIEGSEYDALKGTEELIKKSKNIKCALCTYHNDYDAAILKKLAEEYGMSYMHTKGYMFFPKGINQRYISPRFRKGILRCWKNDI